MAHAGGRPPIFKDRQEMQALIDTYFASDEAKTICGLALALGFNCRETIYEYGKREEFSDIIKSAMLKIENGYEVKACTNVPAGPIFILKNMGWSDKREVEQTNRYPDGIAIKFT